MTYVIGIDGGGTKTTCLFSRLDFQSTSEEIEHFQVVGDGTNPMVIGFEQMRIRLENLLELGMSKFNIQPNEIASIACGLAGVGRLEDVKRVELECEKLKKILHLNESVIFSIYSDAYIALRGSLPNDANDGILVISGTGSNSIGMTTDKKVYTSGGWGHVLGDEGSGFQIGLHALNHITRAYDRRGPETILTDIIVEDLQLNDVKDLIGYIYEKPLEKKEIARLAKHVLTAAKQNDHVSLHIVDKATDELVRHVESLHKQSQRFTEQTPITTTGSIFKYSDYVTTKFINQINERNLGIYYQSHQIPAYGAILLAQERYQANKEAR